MVLCCSRFPNCNRSSQAHATLRRKITILWKRVDHCRRNVSQKLIAHSSITHSRFSCSQHTLTGILFCTCEPTAYLCSCALPDATVLFSRLGFVMCCGAPTNHRCPFICQSNHGKKRNKVLKSAILTDDTVGLKLL
jgi:hypothetical protein